MTKSIAHGLLAFAVLSSLALAQEGQKAAAPGGWSIKPGSGVKYDGGEAFSFNMLNQLQTHWTYSALDNGAADTSNFTIRRARTSFTGNVFNKNILYKLSMDGADSGSSGDGALKEGWATWNMVSSEDATMGLRMGQGKVLFGLEGTGTSTGLTFAERSSAARGFSSSYSRGAWLVGSAMKNQLRWSAGAMNGDVASGLGAGYTDRGEEASNSDNELSYTAMVNFDPLGDYAGGKGTESMRQGDFRTDDKSLKGTVGAGIALGNGRDGAAATNNDIESTSININTAWSIEGLQLIAEYFMRTDDLQGAASDEEESSGWAVSGNWLLPKSGDGAMQWGVGLRFGMVESDEGATGSGVDFLTGLQGIGSSDGDCTDVTVVANAFYHGHAAKTQFEYTWQDVDVSGGSAGDGTNHIFRVAFQLLF